MKRIENGLELKCLIEVCKAEGQLYYLIYRDLNMLDRRVTYKRRASYRTKSNRFRTVKTPGGKLAIQYIKKKTNGRAMNGIKVARPAALKRGSVRGRTVSRPYGGALTHTEVRDK